jgi:hypothetical protein
MIVGVREHLTGGRYLSTTVTAFGKDVARDVGVRTELARNASAAFAALLLPARLVRDVGLLSARRRQRRVRRRLGRLSGATLEFRNPRQKRADLLEELIDPRLERVVLTGELVDPRHQRQHQPLQVLGVERIDPLGWHPKLESRRDRLAKRHAANVAGPWPR